MTAYVIVDMTVTDPASIEEYRKLAGASVAAAGGRFLARGGKTEVLEGVARARNVVIEFASMEDALACYNSPEYTEARKIRQSVSDGEFILVEGAE